MEISSSIVLLNESSMAINSFNPSSIHRILLKAPPLKSSASIFDKDRLIIHAPLAALKELTLADGYHYLQFVVDYGDTSLFRRHTELCTGSQSLRVTVVDELLRSIANITVRMQLVGYPRTSSELN